MNKIAKKKVPQRPKSVLYTREEKLVLNKQGVPKTEEMIRRLSVEYGVTRNSLVRLSGYSFRSIISWAKGAKATPPAVIKLTELSRLFDALADLTQNQKDVTAWIETPNDAFEGSSPLQVIERGESDRIWRMIYFLRSGEPE